MSGEAGSPIHRISSGAEETNSRASLMISRTFVPPTDQQLVVPNDSKRERPSLVQKDWDGSGVRVDGLSLAAVLQRLLNRLVHGVGGGIGLIVRILSVDEDRQAIHLGEIDHVSSLITQFPCSFDQVCWGESFELLK